MKTSSQQVPARWSTRLCRLLLHPEAGELIREIHTRMPVILPDDLTGPLGSWKPWREAFERARAEHRKDLREREIPQWGAGTGLRRGEQTK